METRIMLEAVSFANVTIGRNLRCMREERGLSQVQVAKQARVRPEMLCRIENGQGNPTVRTLNRVLRAIEALS